MKKISWLCEGWSKENAHALYSLIHITDDGMKIRCHNSKNEINYIKERTLAKAPNKVSGRSNFCPECFKNTKHSIPWDERCE